MTLENPSPPAFAVLRRGRQSSPLRRGERQTEYSTAYNLIALSLPKGEGRVRV
jgi:hypothetical protein